jgi:hypothetical protein
MFFFFILVLSRITCAGLSKAVEFSGRRGDTMHEISYSVIEEIFVCENWLSYHWEDAAIDPSPFNMAASKGRTYMHVPRWGRCVATKTAAVYIDEDVR